VETDPLRMLETMIGIPGARCSRSIRSPRVCVSSSRLSRDHYVSDLRW
jgi:hypothetical protein